MNFFATSALLMIFLNPFLHQDKNHILVGEVKNCESKMRASGNRLVLLKDGQIVDKIQPAYSGEFTISNLQQGNYVLEYDNIYGQKIRKKIAIDQAKTTVNICIDEFIDTKISTLFNTMKDGDTLSVDVSAAGCFHSYEENMVFNRKGGKYYAEIRNFDNKKIKKTISIAQLNFLISWGKQARQIDKTDGFCTSSTNYNFKVNNEPKFNVSDHTCRWGGYESLKNKIFGL